jgi:hypothetical protein
MPTMEQFVWPLLVGIAVVFITFVASKIYKSYFLGKNDMVMTTKTHHDHMRWLIVKDKGIGEIREFIASKPVEDIRILALERLRAIEDEHWSKLNALSFSNLFKMSIYHYGAIQDIESFLKDFPSTDKREEAERKINSYKEKLHRMRQRGQTG